MARDMPKQVARQGPLDSFPQQGGFAAEET